MRNLPRRILAPRQAALILATMCNWPRVNRTAGLVRCPITLYFLLVKIKKKRLYQKQPEKGQPYVGIEPTSSAWKADILTVIRIGRIS